MCALQYELCNKNVVGLSLNFYAKSSIPLGFLRLRKGIKGNNTFPTSRVTLQNKDYTADSYPLWFYSSLQTISFPEVKDYYTNYK